MKRKFKTHRSVAHLRAANFNNKYPRGTAVRYWSGIKIGNPPTGTTTTISRAIVHLGYAGVILKGWTGVFSLSQIEVIQPGKSDA